MVNHFLHVSDLKKDEALMILKLAHEVKAHSEKFRTALQGKNIGLYFQKPSMRTRVSFEVGISELGAYAVNLHADEIKIGFREPIKDVSRVLSRYLDGIILRVNRHSDLQELAESSGIPVINGLSDLSHPCQALADMLTIQEYSKNKDLRIVYIGDGNNVCNSLIEIASMLGIEVTVSCPEGYEPAVSMSEFSYKVIRNPEQAVKSADVIYTDVWTSMGQESEAVRRKKIFAPYKVTKSLLAKAKNDCIFMHCLPAHRGEEVDNDVIESEQSVVFQQAENRLHAQKALLLHLMG